MSVSQVLFLQEPGDTAAISINDVNQGSIGDCFLCASVGALALEHPDYIRNMIHDNGNGTQSVRLYLNSSSVPTWITVNDADLGQGMNTNNGGQLIVNGVQEIWPQVIEAALAQVNGGYSTLNMGGLPSWVMPELTGAPAYSTAFFFNPKAWPTTAQLKGFLAVKDIVAFETSSPNGYGLIESHSYTLTSVDTKSGVDYAHFRNPWGYGDPQAIPVSELGTQFMRIDVGLFSSLTPVIKIITGVSSGVRLTGTSDAGSTVSITETVGGQTKVLGTTIAAANGSWSFLSASQLGHIDLSTVHNYSVNAYDAAGKWGSMPGSLFLTDTGNDVLTATQGASDVFAIMSDLGSDVINGFQAASAGGSGHDVIDFSGRGLTSFGQVQALMSGSSSTLITMVSGKTVTLAGIVPSALSAADFRFS